MFQANGPKTESSAVILICDNSDFKLKLIQNDMKRHYTLIKGKASLRGHYNSKYLCIIQNNS